MVYSRKRLALLSQSSFCWYVTSCLLATLGAGLSYVTLSWLILELDDSLPALSVAMLCFWIPTVFLGPFFGVIADRYSHKWLIISGNAIRGLVLILFGWYFQDLLSAHLIYLLMMFLGIGFSIYLPATIALIREIVIAQDLLYANSTIDIAYEIGNVVGMGLSGFFITWLSISTTILITGIIFIFSTLAIIRVHPHPHLQKRRKIKVSYRFIFGDFTVGLTYLKLNTKLIVIYFVQLFILVAFMTAGVLLAPFAKNVLHATVTQFGRIDAALSIGVVVGGIFLPWAVDRWKFIPTLLMLSLGLCLLFSWFGLNRSIFGAEILYLFIGVCLAIWPLIVTKSQHLTEFNFQARMQSVFNSISGIIILLIYLFIDIGSCYISVQWLYTFEAFLAFIALYLLWRYREVFE